MDKLETIFTMQQALNRDIAERRNLRFSKEEWIQKNILAMLSELSEVLDEVNFKWWKNAQPLDELALKQELVDVLTEFGVKECFYGHLHGKSIRYATQGERDGITYRLISADGLGFCPYKIR